MIRVNVTSVDVLDVTPPDDAVKISVPSSFQTPLVPSLLGLDCTLNDDEDGVCDHVSPVMVTLDPSAR